MWLEIWNKSIYRNVVIIYSNVKNKITNQGFKYFSVFTLCSMYIELRDIKRNEITYKAYNDELYKGYTQITLYQYLFYGLYFIIYYSIFTKNCQDTFFFYPI